MFGLDETPKYGGWWAFDGVRTRPSACLSRTDEENAALGHTCAVPGGPNTQPLQQLNLTQNKLVVEKDEEL